MAEMDKLIKFLKLIIETLRLVKEILKLFN